MFVCVCECECVCVCVCVCTCVCVTLIGCANLLMCCKILMTIKINQILNASTMKDDKIIISLLVITKPMRIIVLFSFYIQVLHPKRM